MARNWNKLGLNATTLNVIAEFAFSKPTPVQASSIPLFISNKDVVVQACTGSGKTLAFLIPIFEILVHKDQWAKMEVGAIVIAPTRELARQIHGVAKKFGPHFPQIQTILLIGGTGHEEASKEAKDNGVNLIIGTPGRLSMAVKEWSFCKWSSVEVLVLDEADRILDLGFERDVNCILRALPKQRRTGLFSATLSAKLDTIIKAGLRNPVRIDVQTHSKHATQATPLTLQNQFLIVPSDRKVDALISYIESVADEKVIVFFLTCAQVDFYGRTLPHFTKAPIFALHGKMKQKKRTKIYKRFDACGRGVLLCTDLVARGIDIPSVNKILQFDPPQKVDFFVHRVGRTARAGRKGHALLFLMPTEVLYTEILEAMNTPIQETSMDISGSSREKLRKLALGDRDIMEKSTNAFISFIRAYSEHDEEIVFNMKKLEAGKIAHCMALLKFPKLKGLPISQDGYVEENIDCGSIRFKDKAREKQRQKNLASNLEKAKRKREKEKNKRLEKAKLKKLKEKERTKQKNNRKRAAAVEWDLLALEERLFKKMKKGKISKKEMEISLRNAEDKAKIGDFDDL